MSLSTVSLSFRLKIIYLCAFLLGGISLAGAGHSLWQMKQVYKSQASIEDIKELKNKSDVTYLEQYYNYLSKWSPESRQKAYQQFKETLMAEKNISGPRKNFIHIERQFKKQHGEILTSLSDWLLFYSISGLGLFICCFIYSIYWTKKTILVPVYELRKKMDDFLNNKYSYNFELPSKNEVGDLHSKFNQMAQHVLNTLNQLKNLDKAKSEFLSIASHELRTPLTSIKGSLGLLRGGIAGPLSEESLNLIVIAEEESDRLVRLINDLLDLAKIEAGKFPLDKKLCSLEQIFDKSMQTVDGLAATSGIQLKKSIDQQVSVNVDFDRIQQVIVNLLSNAIKFSPKNSNVTLTVTIKGNKLFVSIDDQGKGISPEDQAAIFEKFRQVTSESSPLVKGTGLGLAISKALIDEHGGVLGVESSPNIGSRFYFTLPEWSLGSSLKEAS